MTTLIKPEDVRKHLTNMAAIIAEAMLKQHGEYTAIVDGKKRHFVVK